MDIAYHFLTNVMMPIMQKRQRVLFDALSKKEQKELHRMIDKLHVAVDAIDNEFVQKNLK